MMLLSEAERDRLRFDRAAAYGIGPVWGVGLNSPWLLRRAFGAFDQWPVNVGFLARGSSSHPGPLVEGRLLAPRDVAMR